MKTKIVKVLHRVGTKIAVTECASVRDSNVFGFIELEGIRATSMPLSIDGERIDPNIKSLLLPKVIVVAIVYPGEATEGRVVPFTPTEAPKTEE